MVVKSGTIRIYRFQLDKDTHLEANEYCECRIGNTECEGELVAVTQDLADISLGVDFGERIREIHVSPKKNELAEILIKRLNSLIPEGGVPFPFNYEGCNKVFGFVEPRDLEEPILLDMSIVSGYPPNECQMDAIRHSLSKEVTFIWGPPGTGKTRTLTVILQQLFSKGKRVLLTSHTNLAVDEILSKYVEDPLSLRYVEDGKIVRYGKSSKNDPALEDLTIESITDKKSKTFLEKIAKIESEISKLEKKLTFFEQTSFRGTIRQLHNLQQSKDIKKAEVSRLEIELETIQKKETELQKRISQLNRDLTEAKNAGFFSRLFFGNKVGRIQEDIDNSIQQHAACKETKRTLEVAYSQSQNDLASSTTEYNTAVSAIREEAKEKNIHWSSVKE